MANLVAYGDSVTIGFGVNAATELYIKQVADAIGRTLVNRASSGDQSGDQSFRAYATPPTTADIYSILVGINDAETYGTDAFKRTDGFIPFLRGLIGWSAMPNKVFARSSAMLKTGTWVTTGMNGVSLVATASGSIATCAVSGTAVYVEGVIENDSSSEGDAVVRCDGNVIGTIEMRGTQIGNTLIGGTRGMAAWRFDAPGPGPHIIEVESTSSNAFILDAVNGSDQIAKPFVYVGDVIRKGAAGYGPDNSDSNVTAYCNAVGDVLAEFIADGANVVGWAANSVIDPLTDLLPDDIHPDAGGHDKLDASLTAAMA